MLKIAVQRSDRISKEFLDLLSKYNLKIEGNQSKLYYKFNKLPIGLYFVRGSDIQALLKSKFDVAVLGQDHNSEHPQSWMRWSMHWYSQILTQKIGMKKFQENIDKLNYGNKDLSVDVEKNNGLTDSWLSSSLKIKPIQQIEFIERLAKNKLPFSKESQIKASSCGKWNLYVKTGTSDFDKINIRQGYFVRFAEKTGKIILFIIHTSGKIGDKNAKTGGLQAKKILLDRMSKDRVLIIDLC